jgi:NADPH:quinone reductase-like Zn-dependent oxidoreductase
VARERNRALCLSIGALEVIDRADDNLEELVVESLKNKMVTGALDCIVDGESTFNVCG